MKILKQKIPFAIFCLTMASLAFSFRTSRAGWTGAMNGTGYGWAGVNVSSYLLTTNVVGSLAMTNPSAAMSPATGYYTNGFLPKGASEKTYSRLKGSEGYVWQASTSASSGDKTDNYELENRVVIQGAPCPELMMESMLTPNSFNGKAGSITVKTVGTAGTALWLRGFEVPTGTEVPVDNPETQNNETTDFLKTNSVLKFENLMVGPFEYGFNGKCELIIYFNLDGNSLDNLIFTSDSVAKSVPLTIECPADQTVTCDQRNGYTYPLPKWTGGCGNVTFTYSPAVSQLAPGFNTVTVTATDESGGVATCSFGVNITGLNFVGFYSPIGTVGGQCSAPAKQVKLGSVVPIKFDYKCGSTFITTGTPPLVQVQPWTTACAPGPSPTPVNAEYQNDWHANWDTTGWAKGTYKVIVTLPDGSKPFVFVTLK